MRDNLPSMLRSAAREWYKANKNVGTFETRYDAALEEAADAVEELGKTLADHDEMLNAYRRVCGGLSPYEVQKRIFQHNWISVEDRLPESEKHVLACCRIGCSDASYVCDAFYAAPKSISCGYSEDCATEYDEEADEYYLLPGWYEVIKNWDDYSSITIEDTVTYWTPLPELPKEET